MNSTTFDPTYPPNTAHHNNHDASHSHLTGFHNPWPSFSASPSLPSIFKARFGIGRERGWVPVPQDRNELVEVRTPDWGASGDPDGRKLRATWMGHASWFIETPRQALTSVDDIKSEAASTSIEGGDSKQGPKHNEETVPRGIRILLDPLFSERTSPFSFFGPKRYTPTPCTLSEVPETDLVCISHNHYDHLDLATVTTLATRSRRTRFLVPLGLKEWFIAQGVAEHRVTELDWWGAVDVNVENVGVVRCVCTPAQHMSARTPFDTGKTLWCSWAIGGIPKSTTPDAMASTSDDVSISSTVAATTAAASTSSASTNTITPSGSLITAGTTTLKPARSLSPNTITVRPLTLPLTRSNQSPDLPHIPLLASPSLYFAGDTGYRTVKTPDAPFTAASGGACPVFTTIGHVLGPFDLALVPIGLYSPRDFMSNVHCCPEDAVDVAIDVRAKLVVGMHYGTVRGGISSQYEDVREPPKRWKAACEAKGPTWGERARLCDVGETVCVGDNGHVVMSTRM